MTSTGTVKSFNDDRGFGFVTATDGTDIFVHIKSCVDGKKPQAGDTLSFDMEQSRLKPGQMQAANVSGGTGTQAGGGGSGVVGTGTMQGSVKSFNPEDELQPRTQRVSDQWHHETFRKHNKDRTDVSFFLCHFTKSTGPVNKNTQMMHDIKGFAHERFEAILTDKKVKDCALPHLDDDRHASVRAVCFTEMMLPSLSMHAENYSPWGIAFHKSFLFNCKRANPVLYCRSELFDSLKEGAKGNHEQLRYMTKFNPKYWEKLGDKAPVDYSHEREWRTPGPVEFQLENLACVFVPDIHLFKELMPVLHADLCKECVEIRVIEKVVDAKSCQHGYGCINDKCKYVHSKDEISFFQFRAMQASGRRGPEEESWRSP